MGTRATVLVVEDNDICREELAGVLRGEGYTVISLSHGQEALDYLGNHPAPDLILLDMLMPVVDGWHFLQRLRATVPVIVATGTILTREWAAAHGLPGMATMLLVAITGYGREADVVRCKEAGIDHHFVKPVDPDELQKVLMKAEERQPSAC